MSDTIKPESVPEPEQAIPESTAVRVYEHADTATEFPVLKAFQEYLEAEQAKAHKRMLSLSIFFIVLLVIVVLTFTIITSSVINRNQELSDRLMDIALRERTGGQTQAPAPIVNVQQPAAPVDSSKSVKPIMDKLEQLQAELAKARAEAEAQKKAAAEARAQAPTAAVQAGPTEADKNANAAAEKALRQLDEIRKQQAAIKAAREQLKAEQEALRKEQIEQQRRRLYPEYYAQEDARRAAEEAAKNPPPALPKPPVQPKADTLPPPQQPQQTPPAPVAVQPTQPEKATLPPPQPQPQVAVNPPPAKPAPKKPSALQAILDEDDAPKSAPKTAKLSPEEAAKVQAELKNLMEQADRLEEEAKEIASQKKNAKTAPLPESNPKPEPARGTESLEVGGKNGKTIPWLLSLPGETPVPEKEDDGEKKPAPQQPNMK